MALWTTTARGGSPLLLGGEPHERGGTFYSPTELDGVSMDAAMACEEAFGAVAGISTFGDEQEAIQIANDTPYGLAACFYSRDIGRIFRVSEQLEYGIVGINTRFISVEVAPFGGVKDSLRAWRMKPNSAVVPRGVSCCGRCAASRGFCWSPRHRSFFSLCCRWLGSA